MAKYGTTEIFDDTGQNATSGGAFTLDHPSGTNETVDVGNGWTVFLTEGYRDVIAIGGSSTTYSDARLEALAYANRGLDLLSAKGVTDLSIVDAEDGHEVWWLTPQGVTLRYVIIKTVFNLDVPPARLTVTDASGNVKPDPPSVPPAWHPSYRYFRRAQTSDDLLDAFRNLYLAFESILDSIVPVRPHEREGDWLKRALDEIGTRINLSGHTPSVPGSVVVGSTSSTAVDQVFNDLYVGNRTAVFHAKSSKRTFLPGDLSDRAQIAEALSRISGLYLAIANEYQGLARRSGGVYSIGFHKYLAGNLDTDEGRWIIYASDESNPFTEEQQAITESGRTALELPTRREVTLDEPFVKVFFAEASVRKMKPLSQVKQLVITNREKHPVMNFVYDQSLTLDGLNCIEVQLGIRARNVRQPKALYEI